MTEEEATLTAKLDCVTQEANALRAEVLALKYDLNEAHQAAVFADNNIAELVRTRALAKSAAERQFKLYSQADGAFYDLVFAITGKQVADVDYALASKEAIAVVERLKLRLLAARAELVSRRMRWT